MVDITLMEREKIRSCVEKDSLSKNRVVFCFYGDGEEQIDFGKTKAKGLCAKLEDISYEEIKELNKNGIEFFEEADIIADAAIKAVAEGNEIICEESTLGASCAAAIREFFTGGGMLVYNKHRSRHHDYGFNVEVYEKVYGALCCLKLLHDDIDFDKLRTGRAAFDKQEMISKIYDLMFEEGAILKAGEDECKAMSRDEEDFVCRDSKTEETVGGESETGGCIYISVWDGVRVANPDNEVFAFVAVTKDKVYHYYCGFLYSELLGDFLDKYTKNDIEYFGVEFWHENNDYGVKYMDSECGNCFTTEHLWTYLRIIEDKFEVKEQDVYD